MQGKKVLALLRIALGFVFLWAFLDKLFGLGFATAQDKSWLAGGSPTTGFLKAAVSGPFADIYHSLAGSPIIDWLSMPGLLCLGLALVFGAAMRLSAWGGFTMMALMYLALLWPANNPVIDEHVIYALALLSLHSVDAGKTWGIGEWWEKLDLVRKFPVLR